MLWQKKLGQFGVEHPEGQLSVNREHRDHAGLGPSKGFYHLSLIKVSLSRVLAGMDGLSNIL